ncbi:MAG: M42 family metallopeptidase [Cyclobacteriaceae bacterium]|nr:M42 family metallopeptidase [Cyclobacteriaceae bacterium]
MKLDVGLLKVICETAGAPGFEKQIRDLIIGIINPYVDEYHIDNLGNLVTFKKGLGKNTEKKVMVAAHMDEIGFVVTHIEDGGFVRFHTLGGFDPKTLTAQRVNIHGKETIHGVMGTKPIHVMAEEEKTKMPKTTDYFIDTGMKKEALEKLIKVGDPITWERELVEMGDCVNCKSIDNRVSVFILIEALKRVKSLPYDFYAVFTVQEEVGLRGANVSAHSINPTFGIALDTTIAYDVPGAQAHEKITELGKGAAIKIMDGSVICDHRMVEYLKQTADKNKIDWQPEVLPAGGTDTAGLQRMGKNGAISGAISVPTRHLHQVIEMANKEDIDKCINLLVCAISELDTFDWSH